MTKPAGALDVIRAAQWLPLEAPEKAVLIAVVCNERMNHVDWVGNPSVAALGMASSLKRRRVQQALATLSNHRLLTRMGNETGGAETSVWRVEVSRIVGMASEAKKAPSSAVDEGGRTTCTGAPHAPASDPLSLEEEEMLIGAGASSARVHHMHGCTECTGAPHAPPKPERTPRELPPKGTSRLFPGAGRPKPERARSGANLTDFGGQKPGRPPPAEKPPPHVVMREGGYPVKEADGWYEVYFIGGKECRRYCREDGL